MATITNQVHIEYIKSVLRKKIAGTGKADTPACQILGKELELSHATLLKVLKGEVTSRTKYRMVRASWFLVSDLNAASAKATAAKAPQPGSFNTQAKPKFNTQVNDHAQQKQREDAAFKRGYNQGKTEGFSQGQRVQNSNGQSTAFARGYAEGIRVGRSQPQSPTSSEGIPMDRLQSLFNMTTNRGAAPGEVVAARNAVGKTLAKWIKEKFGQEVKVQVT